MQEEMKLEIVDKNMLSKSIARRMGLTISDTLQIINIFEDEIITSIKENKKVQLNGFLIFTPKNVDGMKIVSPLDKKEYYIKPKRTVDVRVGKYFKESIKNSYKPSESEEEEHASDKKPKRAKKSTKGDK